MIPGLPEASRSAPPVVPPVTHAGVRYQQLEDDRLPGIDPDASYVVARDVASNAVLWTLQIYRTEIIPGLETDVQAVYFKAMQLHADATQLLIDDEIGRHFVVDLASRSVRQSPPRPTETACRRWRRGGCHGRLEPSPEANATPRAR